MRALASLEEGFFLCAWISLAKALIGSVSSRQHRGWPRNHGYYTAGSPQFASWPFSQCYAKACCAVCARYEGHSEGKLALFAGQICPNVLKMPSVLWNISNSMHLLHLP